MAAGLAVTVALDVALIPTYEAVGAAVASAVAYATVSLALISMFRGPGGRSPAAGGRQASGRERRHDDAVRT